MGQIVQNSTLKQKKKKHKIKLFFFFGLFTSCDWNFVETIFFARLLRSTIWTQFVYAGNGFGENKKNVSTVLALTFEGAS